jgi:CheY-like chemotaxis protein/HPt (histidine-containing phosphotransfer) domain-containing protein
VLLAEDNLINQKVASGLLASQGHRVTLAGNGHEALAALEKSRFDVVLMDIQMPDMDGFEATAIIRQAERASGTRVPIIAMTAHAMKGYRERCLEAGMDGYLAKPVRREELSAILSQVAAVGASRPATEVGPASPAADVAADVDVVNWETAKASVQGDEALLLEIIGIFLDEGPAMLAAIRSSLDAGDLPRLRICAHTLKGAVVHFGATAAVSAAARVEDAAREADPATAALACRELEVELEQVKARLADYFEAARTLEGTLYAVSPGSR